MNKAEFGILIEHPENLDKSHITALKNIASDFPYFQAAHMLLARALFNESHYEFEKQLRAAALIVPDREVLYRYIHGIETQEQPALAAPAAPVIEWKPEQPVVIEKPIESIPAFTTEAPEANEQITEPVVETPAELPVETRPAPEAETTETEEQTIAPATDEAATLPTETAPELTIPEDAAPQPLPVEETPEITPAAEEQVNEDAAATITETEIQPPVETIAKADMPDESGETVADITEEAPEASAIIEAAETPEAPATLEQKPEAEEIHITQGETHSFAEWLQLSKHKLVQDASVEEDKPAAETIEPTPEPEQEAEAPLEPEAQAQEAESEATVAEETKHTEPAPEPEAEPQPEPPAEKPAVTAEETDTRSNVGDFENILDKFIRENPRISRPKAEFYNPVNVARQSVEHDDDLVTETLAQIYYKQGHLKKAIRAYEKLCLVYPHKMAYFASLIQNIKKEIKD